MNMTLGLITAGRRPRISRPAVYGLVMLRIITLVLFVLSIASYGIFWPGGQAEAADNKRVASDNAQMQKSNPKIATRVLEGGTKIRMHFGDTIIPGTLNDSETAQALVKMLPYTVKVNRYSHDFCGVMNDPLPYKAENIHYGWLNGDIDFATDANYFTILFEDEENSEQHGHQVNIGKIDSELSLISNLRGNYDVLIELAE